MDQQQADERQRFFVWGDPKITAEQAKTKSGLDFLRAIARGDLPQPPMASLMNMRLEEADEGRAVFSVQPAEYHYNPMGAVHGGLACTLLDSAMSCAIQTALPAGVFYTTLELKVNLVRPISMTTGKLWCEGKTIHVGQRTGTAEGRLFDAAGKLYAHGVTTCIILKPNGE